MWLLGSGKEYPKLGEEELYHITYRSTKADRHVREMAVPGATATRLWTPAFMWPRPSKPDGLLVDREHTNLAGELCELMCQKLPFHKFNPTPTL